MRSILVHIDASPRAALRLALAQRLASRHGAQVVALYGVLPSMLATPWVTGEGMAGAYALLADVDREQRARARAMFDKAASQGPLSWIDGDASPYWALTRNALYHDLLVLGQEESRDTLTGALPPEMVQASITDTGKPTLVLPYAGSFEAVPSRVLIAWKPTREAARAVTAALPWLHLAAAVHVASRPEEDEADMHHAAALASWLRVQGVSATQHEHRLGAGDVGEALLSLAADVSAELLVMGCYGHSRAREWVLGGASRSILRSMTLPVLMSH